MEPKHWNKMINKSKDSASNLRDRKTSAIALAIAMIVFCILRQCPVWAETVIFSDDFSKYPVGNCFFDGMIFGPWTTQYNGYGCVTVEKGRTTYYLHESPKASTHSNETHAALVVGKFISGPFSYSGKLRTVKQLRTGSTPNAWEVAWILWHYTDDNHFYYFVPKPNGWELGKEDPHYPGSQRFLTTGSWPTFPIGKWYTFKIQQDAGNRISVFVNGVLITTFTDTQSPYSSGSIGLYNEDAHVHFGSISIAQ